MCSRYIYTTQNEDYKCKTIDSKIGTIAMKYTMNHYEVCHDMPETEEKIMIVGLT